MTEYAPFRCACGGGTFYVSADDDQWTCRRCGEEWHGDIMRADRLVAPEMWVYRYVCTEVVNQTERYSPQPLRVVRANRQTTTVTTEQGAVFRLPWHEVAGYYEPDNARQCV